MALRDRRLAALALFVALTVLHTWPLASAPATLGRQDNADAQLNAWALAWVAHALPTQPLHLFDANIFHPDRFTLAYSEHLFVQGVMGAPLAWLGASPPLLLNLMIMAGLALTGWATCLVLHRWLDDWPSAVLGGSLAAFNTHLLTRMGHVQAMHVEFLPFVLLSLDRVLDDPRPREAVRLGLWFTLQSLCSVYLMAMTVIAVVAGALVRAGEWLTRERFARFAGAAAIAGGLAALLCFPFLWPYMQIRSQQGVTRPMDEVALYSADLWTYVTSASRLHYALWSHKHFRAADAMFPGVTPLLLSLVTVFSGIAWRDCRARMLVAMGVAGVVLSFGANLPGYSVLHAVFPLLQGTRATSRFGYLGLVAVAGLAAFGLAHLRRRMPPRAAAIVGVTAVLLVTAESLRAPMGYTVFEGIPAAYDLLAHERDAVVIEFPWVSSRYISRNGAYVLASTRHWKPLVNGYSGFVPASYERHNELFRSFPDDTAVENLRREGITHIVVHLPDMPGIQEQLDERGDLQFLGGSRDIRIYRLAR